MVRVPGLPKLLHRIAHEHSIWDLRTPAPFRRNRGSLVITGGIEAAVKAMTQRVGDAGGVLVVLDADDDCPADLGPALLARAQDVRRDVRVSVVLANKEFEAWFLAGALSLAGQHGFPDDLAPPDRPESIRDAKGWLTKHRSHGPPYKPAVDQAPLASAFDMAEARGTSRSFREFCCEVEFLLNVKRAS